VCKAGEGLQSEGWAPSVTPAHGVVIGQGGSILLAAYSDMSELQSAAIDLDLETGAAQRRLGQVLRATAASTPALVEQAYRRNVLCCCGMQCAMQLVDWDG